MRYHNECYVFDGGVPKRAVIRNYVEHDINELIKIQSECFPPPFPEELWWNEQQLQNHIKIFPDGAICVEVEGKLAGSITSLCIDFEESDPEHTWEEITDQGYIRTHKQDGNTVYIVDISIRPECRKFGLGKLLMQALYHYVVATNRERLLGGGRIPGYAKLSHQMSASEYVKKVVSGELTDPVITFLLRCGRNPIAIVENYLADEESKNYGVLMEWKNPLKN